MSRTEKSRDLDPAAGNDVRRFAVLEHRRDGVHWDFLVEDGAMLRSWAVDEPIRADVTLRARALPPHRRLYLDYEGPIAGDRGEVRLWDAGTVQVESWAEGEVRLLARGGQLSGAVRLWREEEAADIEPSGRWFFRLGKLS